MRFSFGDIIDDIGGWLLVGVLLAGLISVFVSPDLIDNYLGQGVFSMLVMLAIATPLYVCATASTPIAAALVMKGISPGAALVFLLAGPATNVATITVISKIIGKKATSIYVFSIIICSLLMGIAVNAVYYWMGWEVLNWSSSSESEVFGFFAYCSTIVLLFFVVRGFIMRLRQSPFRLFRTPAVHSKPE